jgi:benzaldehyde dehydrogenase (NAD)
MTTDTLLTPAEVWSGKIYSNGWKKPRYAFANRGQRFLTNYDEWLAGHDLGTADVTEKATGAKFGESGIASPEDVSAAAATARQAQKEWAKAPSPKPGDVLREFSRSERPFNAFSLNRH